MGRIQSTEKKLEFNLNSHRRRREFDKNEKEKQVDMQNFKLLKKLVDIQQGRDANNLLKKTAKSTLA